MATEEKVRSAPQGAEQLQFVKVARVEEVPPGRAKEVRVDGRRVLLVNDAGEFYALQALCSHQHLSMDGGTVWRGILNCPWHYFQWDIRTGENIYPSNVYPIEVRPDLQRQVRPLRTYPVEVCDGYVMVGVPCRGGVGRDKGDA